MTLPQYHLVNVRLAIAIMDVEDSHLHDISGTVVCAFRREARVLSRIHHYECNQERYSSQEETLLQFVSYDRVGLPLSFEDAGFTTKAYGLNFKMISLAWGVVFWSF